jgi:hypothetical protein
MNKKIITTIAFVLLIIGNTNAQTYLHEGGTYNLPSQSGDYTLYVYNGGQVTLNAESGINYQWTYDMNGTYWTNQSIQTIGPGQYINLQ